MAYNFQTGNKKLLIEYESVTKNISLLTPVRQNT
jgi:hypothetical protein